MWHDTSAKPRHTSGDEYSLSASAPVCSSGATARPRRSRSGYSARATSGGGPKLPKLPRLPTLKIVTTSSRLRAQVTGGPGDQKDILFPGLPPDLLAIL